MAKAAKTTKKAPAKKSPAKASVSDANFLLVVIFALMSVVFLGFAIWQYG
jgi:hypothetical protein